MILTRKNCSARGRAGGRGYVGVVEEGAFLGDAVEGGGFHNRVVVSPRVRPPPVVREGKQYVRSLLFLCDNGGHHEGGESAGN